MIEKSHFSILGMLTRITSIVLVATLSYVLYENFIYEQHERTGESAYFSGEKPFPPLVSSVGYVPEGLSYQESADYLVKYQKIPGLVDALEAIAKDNPCSFTEGRFKQTILVVTEDATQALIGNSCGSAGQLRSFMVKQAGGWARVGSSSGKFSDTNRDSGNFNTALDAPSCEVVGRYSIQKTIAPICYDKLAGQSSVFAGDSSNYTYTVR